MMYSRGGLDSLLNDKTHIVGADECGYGSLAGPLVVCAVRAPKDWAMPGLNDSKKLLAKKREALRGQLSKLIENKTIAWHLAERSNFQIDKVGLAVALKDAYVECFHALYQDNCLIISDGTLKFDNLGVDGYDKQSVVGADSKFPTVMAASILAKTYRDEKMKLLHALHPMYGWDHNVGYIRPDHVEGIKKHGYCPLHRMSYDVKELREFKKTWLTSSSQLTLTFPEN
jgi:ribonuclease HII